MLTPNSIMALIFTSFLFLVVHFTCGSSSFGLPGWVTLAMSENVVFQEMALQRKSSSGWRLRWRRWGGAIYIVPPFRVNPWYQYFETVRKKPDFYGFGQKNEKTGLWNDNFVSVWGFPLFLSSSTCCSSVILIQLYLLLAAAELTEFSDIGFGSVASATGRKMKMISNIVE